jgi:hypothetical protein
MVVHTYIASTQEAKAGRSLVQGQSRLYSNTPPQGKKKTNK